MRVLLGLVFFGWLFWNLVLRELYIELKYRKAKPIVIPDEMKKEELFAFLKENLNYPEKFDLYYNECGDITVTCKYGEHILTMDNDSLYVSRNGGNRGKNTEEAECLGAYIQKLFNVNAPVNPYNMYRKMKSHKKRWLSIQVGILLFFLIFSVSVVKKSNVDDSLASKNISESYLPDYSESLTVGEAFENFFDDGKWEKFSDGSVEYVDYSGKCLYGEETVDVCIRFWVSDEKFKVESVMFDGEEIDMMLEEALFNAIYEQDENEVYEDYETEEYDNGLEGSAKADSYYE